MEVEIMKKVKEDLKEVKKAVKKLKMI